MAVSVYAIINHPVTSNCYLIANELNNSCIIVDPGSEHPDAITVEIDRRGLSPEYIFLTHEHFDHIWSVNKLRMLYSAPVICSTVCSKRISDSKTNLSLFYNQVGFVVDEADLVAESIYNEFHWNDETIFFISTPGHSAGSLCIRLDNHLFAGDTLMLGERTVTKLPSGSRSKLLSSINALSDALVYPIVFHPGHGESFVLNDREQLLTLPV